MPVKFSIESRTFIEAALLEEYAEMVLKTLENEPEADKAKALKAIEDYDPDVAAIIAVKLSPTLPDMQLELASNAAIDLMIDMSSTLQVVSMKSLCINNPETAKAVLAKLFNAYLHSQEYKK